MNKQIRAITTHYRQYAFRSRLEARYAVYFDHLGIRWDYEPEGFELGNGLRYLPDFWLPDFGLWAEIKPAAPDAMGFEKASRLGEDHHAVIVFCGPPRAGAHCDNFFFGWDCGDSGAGFMPGRSAGHFGHLDGELGLAICASARRGFYTREDLKQDIHSFEPDDPRVCWRRAEDAAAAARAARFEFGAKGGL